MSTRKRHFFNWFMMVSEILVLVLLGPLVVAGVESVVASPSIQQAQPEQAAEQGDKGVVGPVSTEMMTGTVFRVNDDAVTSTEVLAPIREPLRQLAMNMSWQDFDNFAGEPKQAIASSATGQVRDLLLFQHAQGELSNDANFEMMMDQEMANRKDTFLAQFEGSEARAQVELEKYGSSLEDEMERSRRDLVVLYYQQTVLKPTVGISRRQMLQYYRNHLEEEYTRRSRIQFQLIDIQADKYLPTGMANSYSEILWSEARVLAEEAAREAAAKVEQGDDFAAVVQEYSHGFRKAFNGEWRPVDPGSLQDQYQPLVEALSLVEVGQTTGVIEGENRFFIARLLDREGGSVTPFAEVQAEIKAAMTEQNRINKLDKLLRDRLDEASLGDLDKFINDLTRLAYEELSK
ncbi:MAG: hypothetical protein GY869_07870 [Planctomycetes bacterium]|nr:hypothetical protein [Planctomycetota bacterium]